MEEYYERLLKLANSLQNMTTYNFLTIVFKLGLQPYFCVAKIGMKRNPTITLRKQLWFVKKEFLK
jgi:hypothetical protein